MIKKYIDNKYRFCEVFDTKTGMYIRTGVLNINGKDTGVDPFMRSFPALIDVGVMGHCVHGRTGLCMKSGIQCYQNGLKVCAPNMTLENYKKIIDEGEKKGLQQVALGGAGDPDMHENFEDIVRYSAEHDITPNFTTSGLGMTKEKAMVCKQYCGAVAVSMYSRLNPEPVMVFRAGETGDAGAVFTLGGTNERVRKEEDGSFVIDGERWTREKPAGDCATMRVFEERDTGMRNYTCETVRMLQNAGVKTNIHYVIGNNTIDEAIARLRYNGFPDNINAVIFLLHKPVGLGTQENVLKYDDERLREFFRLVGEKHPFKIGFDSCTVPGILNMATGIAKESMDSCEGGRFSMYITADMKALPCSFDNQEQRWAFDLTEKTIEDAWNSPVFDDFRSRFRGSCRGCKERHLCYGGCPIRREVVLCNKKEKELVL